MVGSWVIAVAGGVIGVAGVAMRVAISALGHGEKTEGDFLPFEFGSAVMIVSGTGGVALLVLVGWAIVVVTRVGLTVLVVVLMPRGVVAVVASTVVAMISVAVVPGGVVVDVALDVVTNVGLIVWLKSLIGQGIHLLVEHVVGHVGSHVVGVVGRAGRVKMWWLVNVVCLLGLRDSLDVLREIM